MPERCDSPEQSFEAAFAELEEVVQRLEEAELSLEEAISLYERGQRLSRVCQSRLDQAELRVVQLESFSAANSSGLDGAEC